MWFKLLWPYLKQYKNTWIRMIIMGLLVSGCDAFYPLFNRYAIDHFIGEKTLDTLPVFLIIYMSVGITQCISNYLNVNDCAKLELYINRDLRNTVFEHLQDVSLSYYNQNSVGYIHARVMSDSGKIGQMASWRIMDIVWWGSYILFSIVVMFVVNMRLALWVVGLLPIAVFCIWLFQNRLLLLNRLIREKNSQITSDINEGIIGVRSIKGLVIENKMDEKFKRETGEMYRLGVKSGHFGALFTSTVSLLTGVVLAMVIWKGGEMTNENIIAIGTFSVFMSYAMGMLDPIQNMIGSITQIIAVRVNVERYAAIMNVTGEVFDTPKVIEKYGTGFEPKTENWEELQGDVEFADVSFSYPDGDETVLEHFNLKVSKGSNVAIVGETGAGKSTLVNLVCRFFEPTGGDVLIDGKSSRLRSLKWLHSNIGYVLQTPYLFSGSIRDNLTYGKEDLTDEQIMKALKMIKADEIVTRQKDGLNAFVGEGGDMLSTGEKQLLSIARALLSDPKILILDEATSSIDTVTEKVIQDAIATLIKDRTSFVIAHRLSTILSADMILVVSNGKIVESGTHKELMSKKGEYYSLFTRQYEELIV